MLKLTKRADYGLIALKHLATAPPEAGATTKEIAETYRIPLPLLAKVLQKLCKGGFLRSVQGTNGGYRLAREAARINALEVIRSIDGPIILTSCFTEHGSVCDQSEHCNVREPLRRIHEGILGLLASITIADMASDDPLARNPDAKLYAIPTGAPAQPAEVAAPLPDQLIEELQEC
jgi:Rrf2 family protein